MMHKTSIYKTLQDYFVITFGLLCYAIGFTCFLLPHEIATGGVAGAGAIIFYAFPVWKVQYTYFLANGLLLLAAVRILGWRFCVKTVYATFMLTFLLAAVSWVLQDLYAGNPDLFPSFNAHVNLPRLTNDAFMSALFGAGLGGVGVGLVFGRGGSTGGTDIIASIVNKYRDISLGTGMMVCDIIIITSTLLLPDANLMQLLYGFTTLLVMNLTLDYVYNAGRRSVQFLIFSQKYEEIAKEINDLHRGVTVLNGYGFYTKEERKVLVVLTRKRESKTILTIIHTIDPDAFVSQTLASGVFGDGFDKMKVKTKA